MKKILVIILLICVLFCSSCSDVYEEEIFTDLSEYENIWTMSEKRVTYDSLLFPASVDDLEVLEFFCHRMIAFFDTRWQIELAVRYDDSSFQKEIERLKNVCNNSPIEGESEYFDYPAYATVWNWKDCFEYAVINNEKNVVTYIYLQLMHEEDINMGEYCVLPYGYDKEMDSPIYFVYDNSRVSK